MTATVPDETSAPPALFDHCRKTYKEMLAQAHAVVDMSTVTGIDPDDETIISSRLDEDGTRHGNIIVYEGFLTQLVTSKLSLSVPYYTSIIGALKRMGCIRQLKRGGGSAPSQWELIYEPTLEAFYNAQPAKVRKPDKHMALQEQVDNLSRRVSDMEDWREDVMESLTELFGVEQKVEGTSD